MVAENQTQRDEWDYKLSSHVPHESAVARINGLRQAAKAMAAAYIDLVPAGREQSLALTKLEESSMHAISGVCRVMTEDNPDFVPPETPAEDKVPV